MARLYDSKYTVPGVGHGYNIPSLTFHAMPYLILYDPNKKLGLQNPFKHPAPAMVYIF